MFLVIKLLFIIFLIPYSIYPQDCMEDCPEECIQQVVVWEIQNAITRALSANRSLITSIETVTRADLNLEFEYTEFEWQCAPNGRGGIVGGGGQGGSVTTTLGYDFNKRWMNGTRVCLSPAIGLDRKRVSFKLGAYLSQPLFRGRGYWYNTTRIQAAAFAHRNAIRLLYMAQTKLMVRVIGAMYEIVKQEEIVRFNRESFDRLNGYAQAAKLKEKIGLSDSLDVYRAETELRHAEDHLTIAEERLEEAYDSFRDLLALPMDMPITISVPMEFIDIDFTSEEAVSAALDRRIELDQAQDTIWECRRQLNWAKENMLPDLNLTFDHSAWLGRVVKCTRETLTGDTTTAPIGVGPLYREILSYEWNNRNTWGVGLVAGSSLCRNSEAHFYDNALMNLDASNRNYEQAQVLITLEVKRTLRTLNQAKKRISLQEEQIKNAEGELYLSQIKFNRGFANNFDVIQAERNLRNAHIAYLTALTDHINAEYLFTNNLGVLAEKPCF